MSAISTLSDRRIFFVAVNTGFITDGIPDNRYVEFYEKRSSPELYCSVVGNVVVPGGHGSNSSTPIITDNPIWGEIAKRIADRGASPGIQLATAWAGYTGSRKFVTPEGKTIIAQGQELVASMGAQAIDEVIGYFGIGAELAVNHGFRHIQLHAAHGYLLSLLVDRRINRTADLVIHKLDMLAQNLNKEGIETSVRISLQTGDSAFDEKGAASFQDEIANLSFDFVDLSSGFYNIDKRLIYPSRPEILEERILQTRNIGLRHPNRNFIFSGQAHLDEWDNMPANMHIGFCRDLIANPNFLREPGHGCVHHNKCHYYSRGQPHLSCGKWATL